MEIERWVETLGLGKAVSPPTEVKGGLLHKMYSVHAASGRYAVKVLNGEIMKKPRALQNTMRSEKIAQILSRDIPAVSSVSIEGRQIHKQDGYYFMIFPWLEGRSVYAPKISAGHCRIIGDILGKIHKSDISLDGMETGEEENVFCDWERILGSVSGEDSRGEKWYSLIRDSVEDLCRWSFEAREARAILEQGSVISHRDLDPKNVMWTGMQPQIIDWEAAGYVNPYQELLEVINYWVTDEKGQLQREHFDALVGAYRSHVDIGHVEWDKVFAGSFAGMLGWLEYNARRAAGIAASDDGEKEIGAQQVVCTIGELYAYQTKLRLLKEWL